MTYRSPYKVQVINKAKTSEQRKPEGDVEGDGQHEACEVRSKRNPNSDYNCKSCGKIANSKKILMLTDNEEWKVNIKDVCQLADEAMVLICDFHPNLMHLGNNHTSHRFALIFSKQITNLVNKRAPLQHLAAALVQIFPALILQLVAHNNAVNREAAGRRLDMWAKGDFWEIIKEAEYIQEAIKRKAKYPKTATTSKNKPYTFDHKKVAEAVENHEIKRAAQILDPDNLGIHQWSAAVKEELKAKFPKGQIYITPRQATEQTFKSTSVTLDDVQKTINRGVSKAGGISHLNYRHMKVMLHLKQT